MLLIPTRAHALVVAIDDSALGIDEIEAIRGLASGAEKVGRAQYEPQIQGCRQIAQTGGIPAQPLPVKVGKRRKIRTRVAR